MEDETKDTEELEDVELNQKQELFCQLYASDAEFFGNGVQSYIEAYDPDRTKPHWYDTAASSASRLLRNAKVIKRINEVLEECGLNDVAVDKQLSFLIAQHADFKSKVAAIKEYNKLKGRIIDKHDHTSGGKPFNLTVVSYDGNNDSVPVQAETVPDRTTERETEV